MTEQAKVSKKKPARKQVATPVTGHEEVHAPGTVNIWTGRKLKEYRSKEKKPREASKYRCRPQLDSGWTRGEGMDVAYCCLYFARGLCHHGSDCNYLHRVPTAAEETRLGCDYGHDIFGRDRAPASRDGRKKGVGSYERECRTLYVHYGGAGPLPVLELRQLLRKNFEEWGSIEDIYVVPDKTIAFVRYVWRSSAEFAKVAMHQQNLDGSTLGEVLDVRWANDDPNPRAVERVKREREDSFREAYLQAVESLAPEQKQARLQQLNLLANVRPGCTTSQYPDTDGQFGGGYSHEYQGWDQLYYQQGVQGDGEELAQRQYQQYQRHFLGGAQAPGAGPGAPGGGALQGPDDVSRYLSRGAWEAEGGAGGDLGDDEVPAELLEFTPDMIQGGGGPAGGAGRVEEAVHGADAGGTGSAGQDTAQEVLGLLGEYGSSSDDDEEKGEGGRVCVEASRAGHKSQL